MAAQFSARVPSRDDPAGKEDRVEGRAWVDFQLDSDTFTSQTRAIADASGWESKRLCSLVYPILRENCEGYEKGRAKTRLERGGFVKPICRERLKLFSPDVDAGDGQYRCNEE